MRRASKHAVEGTVLDFSDFSGGLNLRTAPENIAQNELAECRNMTYSSQPGRLRTRAGVGLPLHTFGAPIDALFWHSGVLLTAAGGVLYKYAPAPAGAAGTTTQIGALTGAVRPQFCVFGTDVFIASGGKLQKYDGSTLTTVTDSPVHAVGLYARAGRLFCFETDSDMLRGSAVGDGTVWTIPPSATDADPCETQIGYKVAGNIVAAVPSLTDVIFFKSRATFRLVGEYPEWKIVEISRDEEIANRDTAANVAGYLFYLEKSKGMRLLQGTDGYEEIAPGDALVNINPWLRNNMSDTACRVWNLRGRNILLISAGAGKLLPTYYEYGIASMPALMWEFYGDVRDVAEPDRDNLYIAIGANLHDFSGRTSEDYDSAAGSHLSPVSCSFSTKKVVGASEFLTKRLGISANSLNLLVNVVSDEPLRISVAGVPLMNVIFEVDGSPYIYNDTRFIYDNEDYVWGGLQTYQDFYMHNVLRSKYVQVCFESSGVPFQLTRFTLETVPVGVVS